MRRLVILSGQLKGRSVDLTESTVSIGRADENHLVLEDISVSRRHAVLTFDGQEYRLRDVGSRNGTRVNHKPVQETRLVPGDVIQLGEVELRYELPGARPVAPVVPAAAGEPERLKQLQTQVEQLTAQNRELSAKVQAAQSQLAEAQQRAAALAQAQAELQQARQQAAALQQEKQALAAQVTAAEQRAAAAAREAEQRAATELARLTGELTRVNQELMQLRAAAGQRETAAAEVASLQREKEALTAQMAAARQQWAETEQRLRTEHANELAQLRNELQRVTTEWEQTRARAAELPALTEKLDALQRERTAAQEELARARQEWERLRQALERQRDELQVELGRARQHAEEVNARARERQTALEQELETARQGLASAALAVRRVEELTEQNRALESRLAQVQAACDAARGEAEAARRRVAELEAAAGQTTGAAAAELTRLREELAAAQAAAARVSELAEERQRLASQLVAVEQQLLSAREQAQREAGQARKLEEELARTRQQLELAKKETAKIEIKRPAGKPAGEAEAAKLKAELDTALLRLRELSGELTRAKSELEDLRRKRAAGAGAAAPAPAVSPAEVKSAPPAGKPAEPMAAPKPPEPVGPKAVEPVGEKKELAAVPVSDKVGAKPEDKPPAKEKPPEEVRRHLESEIAALEKKIAEAMQAGMAPDAEPMRRWKSELAVLRASLFNLTVARPLAAERRAAPVGRKRSPWVWVGLGGLVVVLAGLWWWMERSSPVGHDEKHPVTPAVTPVVPPRVITDSGTAETQEPVPVAGSPERPNELVVPPVPSEDGSSKPVEAVSSERAAPPVQRQVYRDARGRFQFQVPQGWRVEPRVDTSMESAVWVVLEPNVIKVEVHGTEWPSITADDLPRLANVLTDRLRVDYPNGLYGMIVDQRLRMVGGEQGGQVECLVSLEDHNVVVRAVEVRKAGRSHYIEFHLHSVEQKALLDLVFEQFLAGYRPGVGSRP